MLKLNRIKLQPMIILSLLITIGIICGIYETRLSDLSTKCKFYQLNRQYEEGSYNESTIPIQNHYDSKVTYDSGESQKLEKEVRVLCWVMTSPSTLNLRAKHVNATWGKRCNKLLFMSTEKDDDLKVIALNVTEGWDYLWGKTKQAFRYIYHNHFDEADWFMKADDDTYVIVENLRYFLSAYKTENPLWFGSRIEPYPQFSYMSGGAGYVLSKEAVRRFVEEGIPSKSKCRAGDTQPEDVEIGHCMENLGIKAIDTRDYNGRGRFFPLVPRDLFIPGINGYRKDWYSHHSYFQHVNGIECCSDTAISFHYVSPGQMYELEYFIYHLKPFGVHQRQPFPPPPPPPSPSEKGLQDFGK